MLSFVVMVLMIGILAGAVAREAGTDPAPLGDIGPWLLGIGGSAIGGVIGLVLLGGGDADRNVDQAWALAGSTLGAIIGAALYVALAAKGQQDVETNTDTRQRITPVSSARSSETGAIDGP